MAAPYIPAAPNNQQLLVNKIVIVTGGPAHGGDIRHWMCNHCDKKVTGSYSKVKGHLPTQSDCGYHEDLVLSSIYFKQVSIIVMIMAVRQQDRCLDTSVVVNPVTDSVLAGIEMSRRSWKPNVQEKRLFSYILDRHIRVKVTTHALRCIDKAGGIDEYLLKTPYKKMDTEMGLFWKAKIEKMYADLGEMEVCFFTPEDEAKFAEGFEELKIAKRAARREARRKMYGWSGKPEQIEEGKVHDEGTDEELVANS
ncbi:hypothetical protein RJ639_034864 [Escallonia herrerae]|uniref:Large ribosomal subunit protein bL28m n=1 Tax=Escallonia herrerae TaxID=1293975 RepID=A0AA89B8K4_9ASTE|nr:hypothetical protein RJ639_034864 [Escallonia herrerae]